MAAHVESSVATRPSGAWRRGPPRRRWVMALFLVLATMMVAPSSSADETSDKATARQLFFQASDALKAGDWAKAADLFHRSNALYPAPTAALGEARALVKVGKLVDAYERYNSVARKQLPEDASEAFAKAVNEARAEVGELEPRLAGVIIVLHMRRRAGGARVAYSARVTVGGKPVPEAGLGVRWLVDPGEHVVRASADGYHPFETKLSMREGETKDIEIVLERDESAAAAASDDPAGSRRNERAAVGRGPSAMAVAGYALGGVGIASLIAAAVTGGLFVQQKGIVDDECDQNDRCTQEGLDAVDRGKMLGWVNTGTLFGGIALVGIGATLVLVAELGDDDEAAELWVRPMPGGAGAFARGSF